MTPTPAPGAARLILRKLREIMSAGESAQARLDRVVTMIEIGRAHV